MENWKDWKRVAFILPPALHAEMREVAGFQGLSEYIRGLIERDLAERRQGEARDLADAIEAAR